MAAFTDCHTPWIPSSLRSFVTPDFLFAFVIQEQELHIAESTPDDKFQRDDDGSTAEKTSKPGPARTKRKRGKSTRRFVLSLCVLLRAFTSKSSLHLTFSGTSVGFEFAELLATKTESAPRRSVRPIHLLMCYTNR